MLKCFMHTTAITILALFSFSSSCMEHQEKALLKDVITYIQQGAYLKLKNLLKQCSSTDLAQPDDNGWLPIHHAVMSDNPALVDMLIDAGASVDELTDDGMPLNALELALEKKKTHVAKFLVERADSNNGNLPAHLQALPLINAWVREQMDIPTLPVDRLSIAEQEDLRPSSLSQESYHSYAEEKINEKSKPNDYISIDKPEKLNQVEDPQEQMDRKLLEAAWQGNLEQVKWLIHQGANIYGEDHQGFQPLHRAALAGHLNILMLFAQIGADLSRVARNGGQALHCAAASGRTEVVGWLLEKRANIHAQDGIGAQPIHVAAFGGHQATVELLVNNHAKLDAQDNAGQDPLDLALQGKHRAVARYLMQKASSSSQAKDETATKAANSDQIAFEKPREGTDKEELESKEGDTQIVQPPPDITIFDAAYLGNLGYIKWFFDNGKMDIDACGTSKCYALRTKNDRNEIACSEGDSESYQENCYPLLHWAAAGGHLGVAQWLIEHGSHIDLQDKHGEQPLHKAAGNGNRTIIQWLIDKGADVNAQSMLSRQPIHNAAENGNLEVIKWLINEGADINALSAQYQTPLDRAAARGHLQVVQWLFQHGAHVKNKFVLQQNNALELAARAGHLAIVQWLFDHEADVECQKKFVKGSIHDVAARGHLELVKWLIDHGASAHAQDKRKKQPIHMASQQGHLEVVKWLVGRRVDINGEDESGMKPIMLAAWAGHKAIVAWLLEHRADKSGALCWAAAAGHLEIVQTLVKHGAHVNAKTGEKEQPLYSAAANGHLKVVQWLVKQGANVNVRNNENKTALDVKVGVERGHSCMTWNDISDEDDESYEEYSDDDQRGMKQHERKIAFYVARRSVIEWLRAEAVRSHNLVSFFDAVHSANLENLKWFVQNGFDVNAQDKHGCQPIHWAAQLGHLAIVEWLVEHGASVYAKTKQGWTPLDLAKNALKYAESSSARWEQQRVIEWLTKKTSLFSIAKSFIFGS